MSDTAQPINRRIFWDVTVPKGLQVTSYVAGLMADKSYLGMVEFEPLEEAKENYAVVIRQDGKEATFDTLAEFWVWLRAGVDKAELASMKGKSHE